MINIPNSTEPSTLSELTNIDIECQKTIRVPENLLANYQKFFDFVIPKSAAEIYLVLPHSYIDKSREMQSTLERLRPHSKIQIFLATKSTDIFLCVN